MQILKQLSAACLLASLLLTPLTWAEEISAVALDPSGRLQRALTGTHQELFADGEGDATPVLAIETVTPAGDVDRVLVPGTGDARLESAPRLFADPRTGAFVLLWLSRSEDDTRLAFTTFDGEFSEVFTLERDGVPVSFAGEPRAVPTRDAFELEIEDAEPIRVDRQVIHLLWQEGDEAPGTHYAPLTFVGGNYTGWHGVFSLNARFLLAPEDDALPAMSAALARTHQLQPANEGRSVLVTFANPDSHRIGSLEISPLPLELGLLGEQVREQIFALADLYDPDDLSVFADEMRAAIVIIGHRYRLHDAHVDYVADRVGAWIEGSEGDYGWGDFESLGDDARDLTIDAGREVYASSAADPADPGADIIRLDVSGLLEVHEPDPAQLFDFHTRSNLPAPLIGDGPVTVHASRAGHRLLIAWEETAGGEAAEAEASPTIHWLESRRGPEGTAWSEVLSLVPGERLSLDDAHRVLAKRIR